MDEDRVYVTGMGVVSCLGVGVEPFWSALCAGQCGLSRLDRFDLEGAPYVTAGLVRGLPAPGGHLSLGAGYALTAAREALRSLPERPVAELGVVLATNFGPSERFESALDCTADGGGTDLGGLYGRDVADVAEALDAVGPRVGLSLSCASGNAAIAHALDLLRADRAEAVLACGYDSIQPISWAGLCALRVMALPDEDGVAQVRPFDRERAGTVFSEGAGCLLLEAGWSAMARGATPLAEVAGAAANNNAFHLTHADEDGRGTAVAIRQALDDAGVQPGEVDHVNAHGTGTKLNDLIEARALHAVLGERAGSVPVVSLKGAMGHGMGAASALEAVACVLTLREGVIPPTVNHEEQDAECGLDVVHGAARRARVRCVLSNSAGIGGANAAVVLRGAGARAQS